MKIDPITENNINEEIEKIWDMDPRRTAGNKLFFRMIIDRIEKGVDRKCRQDLEQERKQQILT